ncbi:MAG: hypothetical protein Q9225_001510 [Loekoesia sp. 1 TL-2023]
MPVFRSLLLLNIFILSLCLSRTTFAATGQGSVSLWSDSSCGQEEDAIAFSEPGIIDLNLTLSADTCHNLGRAAHSYIVDDRPTCDNGTIAAWAFYNGNNCQRKGFGPALNAVSYDNDYDGSCLALVEFNSIAFICDGVSQGASNSTPPSQPSSIPAAVPDTAAFTPTATPIAPSNSPTAPIYTIPGTPANTLAPSGTAGPSAGQPFPTGSLPPSPSPSPFTGAASGLKISLASVLLVVAAKLLL